MPVMDCLEVTRLIRADRCIASTPVLAMTANAGAADRARCIEAGMNDFVDKPVDPQQLYATVTKWLRGRQDAPAPESAVGVRESTTSAGDPEIDLAILSRSVAGDLQKVRRYAGMFAEEIPATLAELQATWALGDLQKLADLAHRWKASSKMVGAMGLVALCQSLEDCRDNGTLEQAGAVILAMPAMLARVSDTIARELA